MNRYSDTVADITKALVKEQALKNMDKVLDIMLKMLQDDRLPEDMFEDYTDELLEVMKN